MTGTQADGGLVAEATGLGIAPIYPASETDFLVRAIPVQLTFQVNPAGAVTGLVLRFAGRQTHGTIVR